MASNRHAEGPNGTNPPQPLTAEIFEYTDDGLSRDDLLVIARQGFRPAEHGGLRWYSNRKELNLWVAKVPLADSEKVGILQQRQWAKELSMAYEESRSKVSCICRQPMAGKMVECEACKEWYHCKCVGFVPREESGRDKYICLACERSGKTSRRNGERPELESTHARQLEKSALPDTKMERSRTPPGAWQSTSWRNGQEFLHPGPPNVTGVGVSLEEWNRYQEAMHAGLGDIGVGMSKEEWRQYQERMRPPTHPSTTELASSFSSTLMPQSHMPHAAAQAPFDPQPAASTDTTASTTQNPLGPSAWDHDHRLFTIDIFTIPPQPSDVIIFPKEHLPLVIHLGYVEARDGALLRLEDCPEGYSVWTGRTTFCDTDDEPLKPHPSYNLRPTQGHQRRASSTVLAGPSGLQHPTAATDTHHPSTRKQVSATVFPAGAPR
ncbi:hypothetical protein LTR36_003787 [Oleoguttula mirabilis]|uniref:PHD-type domain-containing protein n=1 Tax=Oleoguttula mirabilis TaxID=1507867 RepID=A0AAV9JIX7_9PEZI|nr:hypothetical protein LTR36_003787 [Oleoguttula mirabilis]